MGFLKTALSIRLSEAYGVEHALCPVRSVEATFENPEKTLTFRDAGFLPLLAVAARQSGIRKKVICITAKNLSAVQTKLLDAV